LAACSLRPSSPFALSSRSLSLLLSRIPGVSGVLTSNCHFSDGRGDRKPAYVRDAYEVFFCPRFFGGFQWPLRPLEVSPLVLGVSQMDQFGIPIEPRVFFFFSMFFHLFFSAPAVFFTPIIRVERVSFGTPPVGGLSWPLQSYCIFSFLTFSVLCPGPIDLSSFSVWPLPLVPRTGNAVPPLPPDTKVDDDSAPFFAYSRSAGYLVSFPGLFPRCGPRFFGIVFVGR